MRFIADSMLGRLARWLRLLGYDTLYFPKIEDCLLLRIAREEGRTILTRDTRLVRVRGLTHYLLLRDNDPFDQLRAVITAFGLASRILSQETGKPSFLSRCSLCNRVPDPVPRDEIKDSVPDYVYRTADSFRKCMTCQKVYWKGTHQKKLIKKLMETL